jgi:hypothetical protein
MAGLAARFAAAGRSDAADRPWPRRVLAYLEAAHRSEPVLMVGLFALFVPALAYACLTGLWLLRTLVDVARLTR